MGIDCGLHKQLDLGTQYPEDLRSISLSAPLECAFLLLDKLPQVAEALLWQHPLLCNLRVAAPIKK